MSDRISVFLGRRDMNTFRTVERPGHRPVVHVASRHAAGFLSVVRAPVGHDQRHRLARRHRRRAETVITCRCAFASYARPRTASRRPSTSASTEAGGFQGQRQVSRVLHADRRAAHHLHGIAVLRLGFRGQILWQRRQPSAAGTRSERWSAVRQRSRSRRAPPMGDRRSTTFPSGRCRT